MGYRRGGAKSFCTMGCMAPTKHDDMAHEDKELTRKIGNRIREIGGATLGMKLSKVLEAGE